jgi:hypothetical protein
MFAIFGIEMNRLNSQHKILRGIYLRSLCQESIRLWSHSLIKSQSDALQALLLRAAALWGRLLMSSAGGPSDVGKRHTQQIIKYLQQLQKRPLNPSLIFAAKRDTSVDCPLERKEKMTRRQGTITRPQGTLRRNLGSKVGESCQGLRFWHFAHVHCASSDVAGRLVLRLNLTAYSESLWRWSILFAFVQEVQYSRFWHLPLTHIVASWLYAGTSSRYIISPPLI